VTTPTAAVAPARLALHRAASNPFYKRAIETDEHLEAVALHEKLTRKRAELEPTPRPPVPTSVEHDLDELLFIAVNLDADEDRRVKQHNWLTAWINQTENRIQSELHQHDRIIAALGADHDETMREMSEVVARLRGARTATEAIKAGVADDYAALEPLIDKRDSIIQAYFWTVPADLIIRARSEYLEDDLATDLLVGNLDDIMPSWKQPPRNTALQLWGDTRRHQPWPADRIEQAIWMCTSGVQMRLATTKQVRELWAQRIAGRAHPDGEPPQPKPERIELNQPPRQPDYNRIAKPIVKRPRPAELTELGAATQ
jgi:hypothetical protein